MALKINGRDASEQSEPAPTPPKPPRATKFIQILSDGPGEPLFALDSQGIIWQLVAKPVNFSAYGGWQGTPIFERYWVPLPNERRAE